MEKKDVYVWKMRRATGKSGVYNFRIYYNVGPEEKESYFKEKNDMTPEDFQTEFTYALQDEGMGREDINLHTTPPPGYEPETKGELPLDLDEKDAGRLKLKKSI